MNKFFQYLLLIVVTTTISYGHEHIIPHDHGTDQVFSPASLAMAILTISSIAVVAKLAWNKFND